MRGIKTKKNILEVCRYSYDDGKKGVEHLVFLLYRCMVLIKRFHTV